MDRNTNIRKASLEQLNRKQRKYTILTSYLNELNILQKHGML